MPKNITNNKRKNDIQRAEKAFGGKLPLNAVVHHHSKTSLVICENQAYHCLIHTRMKLINNNINPHKRKCRLCCFYDYPENMVYNKSNRSYHHQECHNTYKRQLRRCK